MKGIVFAGPGPASLSKYERAAIQKVNTMPNASRPVIVRASRAGNGRATDAGPEYVDLQTLTADNLSPHKARILLMLALTRTSDAVELKRIFAEYWSCVVRCGVQTSLCLIDHAHGTRA